MPNTSLILDISTLEARTGDQHLCYNLSRSKYGLLYFLVSVLYLAKLSYSFPKQCRNSRCVTEYIQA